MSVKLICCVGTDINVSNPNLLEHFLNHYLDLGINQWVITLHASGDDKVKNLSTFEEILKQNNIPYRVWIGRFSVYQRTFANNLFISRQSEKDWFLGVDFDEFVEFPNNVNDYLADLDKQGFNCVKGKLCDRIDSQGKLSYIVKDKPLKEQFPLKADVKKYISQPLEKYQSFTFEKKIAIKKPLRWAFGNHTITDSSSIHLKESPQILEINHYAWDSLLLERRKQRFDNYSQNPQTFDFVNESLNLLKYVEKHGHIQLKDVIK